MAKIVCIVKSLQVHLHASTQNDQRTTSFISKYPLSIHLSLAKKST